MSYVKIGVGGPVGSGKNSSTVVRPMAFAALIE
jgi:Ni2+-binding GTPase involved in maturation of urease and hydrogenase